MPSFLATYDLEDTTPDPHSRFLAQARENGWNYWILWNEKQIWYRLPNTTLIGNFSNKKAAVDAFKKIASDTRAEGYRVTVEKWIIVEYDGSSWNGDVKQPKK